MPGTVDNKLIYHLAVLIPFWTLQLIAEILIVAFGALGLVALIALSNASNDNEEVCYYDTNGNQYCYNDPNYYSSNISSSSYAIGYGSLGAELGLGIIFLISHIVQIALFGRKKLTPAANFGFEITRTILWTIVFILSCVSIALATSTIASIAFTVILWALYLGSLIYASVIFHRSRRGMYNGSYTGTQPSTYPHNYSQPQEQMSYGGPGPYQNPSNYQTPGQTSQYAQPSQYQPYNAQAYQQPDLHRSLDTQQQHPHSPDFQQPPHSPDFQQSQHHSTLHQQSGAATPQPASVSPHMIYSQPAHTAPYPSSSPPPQEMRGGSVPPFKN